VVDRTDRYLRPARRLPLPTEVPAVEMLMATVFLNGTAAHRMLGRDPSERQVGRARIGVPRFDECPATAGVVEGRLDVPYCLPTRRLVTHSTRCSAAHHGTCLGLLIRRSGRLQRPPSVSHHAQMVRSEMPESKRPADG
jgi:hypothetical protein